MSFAPQYPPQRPAASIPHVILSTPPNRRIRPTLPANSTDPYTPLPRPLPQLPDQTHTDTHDDAKTLQSTVQPQVDDHPLSRHPQPSAPYLPLPSSLLLPTTPTPKGPLSPFTSFFRSSTATNTEPSAITPSRLIFSGLNSPSPSTPSKTPALVWEIYLDTDDRSLRFIPYAPKSGSDRVGNVIPLSPVPKARHSEANDEQSEYAVTAEIVTEKEIVLLLKKLIGYPKGDGGQNTSQRKGKRKEGETMARLMSSIRGTEIDIVGEGKAVIREREGSGNTHRIFVDDESYSWAESTMLTLFINTATRVPLAKMQYRIIGRDRLTILGDEGIGRLEMIMISAAKLWFDHQSGRDFRVE